MAVESFDSIWHEASRAMAETLAETFEQEWAGREWTSAEIAEKLRRLAASCGK